MAGMEGVEPPLTEPESAVLPLDDIPVASRGNPRATKYDTVATLRVQEVFCMWGKYDGSDSGYRLARLNRGVSDAERYFKTLDSWISFDVMCHVAVMGLCGPFVVQLNLDTMVVRCKADFVRGCVLNHMERKRNSSFELLRIVAMLAIVGHHLIVRNVDPVTVVPGQVSQLLIEVFFNPVGRIGVAVFIGITAWFSSASPGSLKSSLRKIWMLNAQVTFYSLAYFVAFGLMSPDGVTFRSFIQALFPLLFGTWWFPTAFAVYMVLLPFFLTGFKALGKGSHKMLCVIAVILFGVLAYFPTLSLMAQAMSLVGDFFVITIVVTYARWYVGVDGLRERRRGLALLLILGVVSIAVCFIAGRAEIPVISRIAQAYYDAAFLQPASIISLSIAIPLVLLAAGHEPWCSTLINRIASLAFGVYLITDYAPIYPYLWGGLLSLSSLARYSPCVIACGLSVVLVFASACAIDCVRAGLFSRFLNRRLATLFDVVWSYLSKEERMHTMS